MRHKLPVVPGSLTVVLSTSRKCRGLLFSGRMTPVVGSSARHNSWSHSSAVRSRLNKATAESSATPAALARTTVSCKEYPRAKCNKSVRSRASTDRTPRNRLLAPVSTASSCQLLGKRERSVCQFCSSIAVLRILAPRPRTSSPDQAVSYRLWGRAGGSAPQPLCSDLAGPDARVDWRGGAGGGAPQSTGSNPGADAAGAGRGDRSLDDGHTRSAGVGRSAVERLFHAGPARDAGPAPRGGASGAARDVPAGGRGRE